MGSGPWGLRQKELQVPALQVLLGQDLQVSYLGPDAAHYNFTVSESLVLKIEAPDAIDRTILATRQAVFPLLGLDPADPRD